MTRPARAGVRDVDGVVRAAADADAPVHPGSCVECGADTGQRAQRLSLWCARCEAVVLGTAEINGELAL